ncbi:unnamed protein product [Hermetia illucens]|uniref:SCP domain-containing protein n=1 Tax=Hermetia illucens TaxID=343691 RepID=A0A7R8V013_HERIL|nr:unnamed protein product [Hermetia illucens]
MKFLLIFAIILSSTCVHLSLGWTVDYCSPSLCKGLPHIACGHPGDYHRNKVAGGRLPGFSPAVRMATMVWDEELAYLASLNALRCDFEHDECRNTDSYRNSGQSLAWRWDPMESVPQPKDALTWAIDYWFGEHVDSNMQQIDRYYVGHGTEHFTVMVAESNERVGCAGLWLNDGDGMTSYIVCNYATTNILDRPIYRQGAAGSECRHGRNRRFSNLCAVGENYNVSSNRW